MEIGFTLKCVVLFSLYCFVYISGRKKIEKLIQEPNATDFIKKQGFSIAEKYQKFSL